MASGKLSSPITRSLAISTGLWTFAVLYRGTTAMQIFAALALLATAILIVMVLLSHNAVLLLKNTWRWNSESRKVLMLSIILSVALATWYRISEQMTLLPFSIHWFVLLSVMIGATEELIFRGVIQGEASGWNTTGAVYLSALSFAGYKALLFVMPSPENETNVFNLFILTFFAGILLGYARKNSGSIWPCLVAHGFFDLLVYAETATPPWWVW
jgi:membrane protease YdiL (CAAX protease family)